MAKKETDELKDLEAEYHSIHSRYLQLLTFALILIIGGATVYHHLLHLTWVNAFYFCTVTLTTVGYGDITPNNDASKIFTIFYILIGIGIIATFASLLVRNASLKRELRRTRRRLRRTSLDK